MSDFQKLLVASKSNKNVYKFLIEFLNKLDEKFSENPSSGVSPFVREAAEVISFEETVVENLFQVFAVKLASDKSIREWTVASYVELCFLCIKCDQADFYVQFFTGVPKTKLYLEKQFRQALSCSCSLYFFERFLAAIKEDVIDNPDMFFEMMNFFALSAAEFNRPDILDHLYKEYKWNSSACLREQSVGANQNVVKWILQTFYPITPTNGHHSCPETVFYAAAKCSDTTFLEWLMEKCGPPSLMTYFVDKDSPFYDDSLRLKLKAAIAADILKTSCTSTPAKKLLTDILEVGKKYYASSVKK